jgi:hypothetical protein
VGRDGTAQGLDVDDPLHDVDDRGHGPHLSRPNDDVGPGHDASGVRGGSVRRQREIQPHGKGASDARGRWLSRNSDRPLQGSPFANLSRSIARRSATYFGGRRVRDHVPFPHHRGPAAVVG